MADNFKFDLVSPERLVMSEPAAQVVVPGTEGQFTVMAGHAPVMTTLRPGVLEATLGSGKRERIFVRGGFADVNAAGLTVLAEQAIPLAELDAATINGLIQDADAEIAAAKDETTRADATLKRDQLRAVAAEAGRPSGATTH
ncbi:MAG: F0F1 ATP synthase subunit epsilon [Bauldia sp.]|nr:F0F1 ATP synthase subunit epsilon [Bauldia sp.]